MDEDERIVEETSTHGALTTDPELLARIPDWMLRRQVEVASSRYQAAAVARLGLTKALLVPPGASDEIIFDSACGASVNVYAVRVLNELGEADEMMSAYTAESVRRMEKQIKEDNEREAS